MIRYLGTRTTPENKTLYLFLINGMRKEVRESAFRQYPGCFEALPLEVRKKIEDNRRWLAQL
jgi:hypothetical protein